MCLASKNQPCQLIAATAHQMRTFRSTAALLSAPVWSPCFTIPLASISTSFSQPNATYQTSGWKATTLLGDLLTLLRPDRHRR